jgi:methionine biosynthesis protein MetW
MRYDLQIIASWIEPGSRVLDLGCGEGELLKYLIDHKNVIGSGIEHDEAKVAECNCL